ncbi:hypothetical protein Nepgr_030132 [Nepenthes gracilis]|uniref:snRNA-activating protein complex subunit n=1 Tax=Nepenthes gracilis TaxID=150966 RepID=A0AAD3Y5S0_NEPGR|nr:hypothetical protein Nepgr_030132 [Nepenthes gracilis]
MAKTTEMTEPSRINSEDARVSIPRGGPIFVSDLVGPLTRVSDFESAIFYEIDNLKAELSSGSSIPVADDEDISVDELKVFTDEELVSEAKKEAFKDGKDDENSLHSAESVHSSGEANCRMSNGGLKCSSWRRNVSVSCESSSGPSRHTSSNGETNNTKPRKRKGREMIFHENNNATDESYLAKAEELAKIRQKQIEDKAAAKLHSTMAMEKNIKQKNKHEAQSSENTGRLKSLESLSFPTKVKSTTVGEHVAVPYPEVVLCIELYHNRKTCQKTQEIMVVGQQTLTELRDKIYCLTDVIMQKAGKHDPSAYFLIEDVFYNDLRNPSAINYSEPILDWLRNSKEEALAKWESIISGVVKKSQKAIIGDHTVSQLPRFEAVEMQKARFCDVRFRLGASYLYCHQGDCKHAVVIRDMRLIHPEDVQSRAAYPLLCFQQKFSLKKCSVCAIYKATKVTVDDKWAGLNPCYFCENCYYLLHYAADGSLLYDRFSVYEYLQDY